MSNRPAFLALALTLGVAAGPAFSQANNVLTVSQGRSTLEHNVMRILRSYHVDADTTTLSLSQLARVVSAAGEDSGQIRQSIVAATKRY